MEKLLAEVYKFGVVGGADAGEFAGGRVAPASELDADFRFGFWGSWSGLYPRGGASTRRGGRGNPEERSTTSKLVR
jgi:hypothetical protein